MAPFPPNNSARLWVQYSGPAGIHDVMFRYADTVSTADAVAAAARVCGALKAWLTTGTTFESARFASELSDISLPVTWTPIVGTSAEVMSEDEYPNFVSFVGRGNDGVRTRVTLNGIPANPDADYRIPSSAGGATAAVLTALADPLNLLITISNSIPIWNPYANLGRNAYFQRKRRRIA